uniref:JAB domain-containing protein n=1 Tax=Roseivirga sp. TaxID=1964215 RepID=UPI004048244B
MLDNLSEWQVSEVEVSYKPQIHPVTIHDAMDAHLVFKIMWDKHLLHIQEQFGVLYLNNANKVLSYRCLHTGTTNSINIDMRLLFGIGLKMMAAGIIVAHNHPAGANKPSKADLRFTRQLYRTGKFLNMPLLDHIILAGSEDYYSFKTNKTLKP